LCPPTQLILLDDRLRLVVPPEKVRLQPRPEDGYAWSVAGTNADLLKSSLSGGSTRLYQLICSKLGRSLEAVNPQSLNTVQSNTGDLPKEVSPLPVALNIALLTEHEGTGFQRRNSGWFFHSRDL
jgi:hypothetical protein